MKFFPFPDQRDAEDIAYGVGIDLLYPFSTYISNTKHTERKF